jgi:coproporphyrinogen III oxidase-like Fe-S oxidoreductase
MRAVESDEIPVTDGYLMGDEERERKAVILNLIHLDRSWFRSLFGRDAVAAFPLEFEQLVAAGICEMDPAWISLTAGGTRVRDLAVQMFLSAEVRSRLRRFSYSE